MKIASLTALALILGSTPLLAQTPETAPGRLPIASFAEIDADGDGRITREEWQAHLAERMTARRAERLGAHADALLAAGDADGDGRLDRDELIAALEAVAAERRAAMAERHAARHEMRQEGRGMRGEMRPERRGEMRGEMRGERRGEMRGEMRGERREGRRGDADRGWHGRRSAEAPVSAEAFAARSFARIDTDRDGAISPEEYATAVERMERMQARRDARPGRGN